MSRPQSARFARYTMIFPDVETLNNQIAERRLSRLADKEASLAEKVQEEVQARAVEQLAGAVHFMNKAISNSLASNWKEQIATKTMRTNWDLEDPHRFKNTNLPRNPEPCWKTKDMGRTSGAQTFAAELREDPQVRAMSISSVRNAVAFGIAEKELKAVSERESAAVEAGAQAAMRTAIAGMEAGIAASQRHMAIANRQDNKALMEMRHQHYTQRAAAEEEARVRRAAEEKAFDAALLARVHAERAQYRQAREVALGAGRPGTAPALFEHSRRGGAGVGAGNGRLTQAVERLINVDAVAAQIEEKALARTASREDSVAVDATILLHGAAAVHMAHAEAEQRAGFVREYYRDITAQAEVCRARKAIEKAERRRAQTPVPNH